MCIVKSCCCFDLKTGGLIIGSLNLIFSVLQLFSDPIAGVIGILISAALLYGIHAEKPSWMLFSIILSIIGVVLFAIVSIVILFLGTAAATNQPEGGAKMGKNDREALTTTIIIFAAFCAIGLGLQIYFTSVLYSLYKQIKENLESRTVYNHGGMKQAQMSV